MDTKTLTLLVMIMKPSPENYHTTGYREVWSFGKTIRRENLSYHSVKYWSLGKYQIKISYKPVYYSKDVRLEVSHEV